MLYKLSKQFQVLIDLLCDVISIAAIEVNEPFAAGYDTGLHYYRPQTAFQNTVINCIWSVAGYVRHIGNGENIRYIEPLVGQLLTETLRWSLWLNSFRCTSTEPVPPSTGALVLLVHFLAELTLLSLTEVFPNSNIYTLQSLCAQPRWRSQALLLFMSGLLCFRSRYCDIIFLFSL